MPPLPRVYGFFLYLKLPYLGLLYSAENHRGYTIWVRGLRFRPL